MSAEGAADNAGHDDTERCARCGLRQPRMWLSTFSHLCPACVRTERERVAEQRAGKSDQP